MSRPRIQVLDGGMGTTLESLGANVSTPLWGCDLLQTDPEVISSVHRQFAGAGADLIQTATYQLTLPALCAHARLDEAEGSEVMCSAIPLAAKAGKSTTGVVLSIGPFGATLSPSQEYKGIYPPPYGPSSSQDNEISGTEESTAIDALEESHFSRLLTFSQDPNVWALVAWIAFETVPLLTEYKAIRRAMARLYGMKREKKFWITSAWPDGLHPSTSSTTGTHASVREVLHAALLGEGQPANGVGLNCTNPAYIAELSREFTKQLEDLRRRELLSSGDVAFVLYPDGGSVYDTVTRTWSSGGLDPESWGRQVSAVASEVESASTDGGRTWSRVIVGGCCKAGFDEIRALADALKESGFPARE